MILTSRRRFLAGLFVAPAIIPAARLMRVASFAKPPMTASEIMARYEAQEISNEYEAYVSFFGLQPLVRADWRYVAKIANI